jgi:hypothetical protein
MGALTGRVAAITGAGMAESQWVAVIDDIAEMLPS